MERLSAPERTLEELRALMNGELGTAAGRGDLVRLALRLIVEEALEGEVSDALGRERYERGEDGKAGYRNGYRPGKMKTAEGAVDYSAPQVRDTPEPFVSNVRAALSGRTRELERLAVELYARGLSTRDIEDAFTDETGQRLLSRAAVSEITEKLWAEYEDFCKRDLSEHAVAYLFIDGIAERLRPGQRREAVLAAWGIGEDGRKSLLGLMAGSKEDVETVRAFFQDLRARGMGDPLLVVSDALFAAGGVAWRAGLAPRFMAASVDDKLANAPRLSIVVLPFENLSGDKEQDYFADGITDDLTTDISSHVSDFVIARGTAFTYKGKPVDAKQIGKDLGVRYVLEGSVRRVGERITINAQLISTETGAHVWADRFDGDRSKLGELQVEAVSRLANSLGVELIKAEALRAARERPNNPDAVDLAMRGSAIQYSNNAGVTEALGYYERALQLDPGLTTAQIGLAETLVNRFMWYGGGTEAVDIPRAEALLASALSAEPNNAYAHYTKAQLLGAKKQFSDQFAEIDAAIENNRNYAWAYSTRAQMLIWAGRAAEAIAEDETALRLSPRDPGRWDWEFGICHAYTHLAQWEKAIEWCQKSIATNAENWFPYMDLAVANAWLGHDTEAKTAIAGLLKVYPGLTVQSCADLGARLTYTPTFAREFQRILEGLRKAGLPEGEKKTD